MCLYLCMCVVGGSVLGVCVWGVGGGGGVCLVVVCLCMMCGDYLQLQ